MRSKSLTSTSHPKYQKVTVSTVVTTQQTDSIVPCPLLLDLGKRGGKEVFSISWESSVFSPGTRSSMNTSGMWVTHRERDRTKLCDPPKFSEDTKSLWGYGAQPSGETGEKQTVSELEWLSLAQAQGVGSDRAVSGTPPLYTRVRHWARGAAGGRGQDRERAGGGAPPAASCGGRGGCVLPGPWRSQGFRKEGSGPAQGRDRQRSTLSRRDGRRLPIPHRQVRRDRSAASRAGRLGSPLGYRPRLLAAAAAAAVTAAAGRPQPLCLCQPLLLLLPPPPPPGPHRSHRRCGDYCSARWPDPTLFSPFATQHSLAHLPCQCARPPLRHRCWLESASQARQVGWLVPLPITKGAES